MFYCLQVCEEDDAKTRIAYKRRCNGSINQSVLADIQIFTQCFSLLCQRLLFTDFYSKTSVLVVGFSLFKPIN